VEGFIPHPYPSLLFLFLMFMAFDPFSQVNSQEKIIEKPVYLPEGQNYILGIESRTFFGIFTGILIAIIFISILEGES